MLKQITAPDHVIALSLDGTLTSEDIQEYNRIYEKKLQQHDQIGIYVDITTLDDMKVKALIDGARADMKLLRHLKQLNRCAYVSDKEWPKAAISLANRLLPTLEMKVFPSSQSEEALSWAAEKSEQPLDKSSAIRFLPTNKENVLAFEVDGVLSLNEMPSVTQKLEQFFNDHDTVRLLARMKNYGGFDPSILIHSNGLISMKIAAMKKVERYAIVGAPSWMCKLIETLNPVFPKVDMKTFTADHENDALVWLEAELVE
ncbi:MAG TPA: STAS/SEC14 domain-containing protein [Psychrobacter sp.]|uniref:STAS/SEC14 domain-containing protein n=1 Tax=Psychrobacter sp. TaxID=56811 RepID=UPI002C0F5D87|nr:STAS/SEC14 domain-containing protein [Psychrobacter sp.]HSP85154.1 STAS/SEC14 domain-containing protein [Psychrobacter sp.]